MNAFSQLNQAHSALVDFEPNATPPAKRPSRWALSNWSARWKVFAIVLVPMLLAGMFGGLHVYTSAMTASDLQRAADRAEMVPAIAGYMAALEGAMSATSTGGDTQAALTKFDTSRQELQRRLADTDVAPHVREDVTTLVGDGQALMERVTSNTIGLRDLIGAYAQLLLPAEDSVNGSVQVDDERIRAQTLGLSRAIDARGQMTMLKLAVTRGAELPEPELRTAMITLAGTEPSTLFGMSQVLGVGSPDAQQLQAEVVKRMALISDPAVPLVNNPELLASVDATDAIAARVIERTTGSVTSAVEDLAAAQRTTVIRDAAIVGGAILLALLVVIVVARSLVRPLRTLRDSALRVAHDDLAREIEHVRAGGEPAQVEPIAVHTSEEVGQIAHAVDELHEQAVLLAGEQSRLQLQVGDMFETLSRRSRSLVDQQLSLIDQLELDEEDPERLKSLFRLDHLAARMRRNGANLLVLASAKVPREQAEPVPVSTLINAAASEVEDYTRVVTATVPDSEVLGAVAGDLVHLLAELLDNALRYSPPTSQVRVSAVHTANGGLVIEVSDIGLGMTESDLRVANTRLQSGGEVTPYTARHMGLFVVSRLAAQHGLVVRLRSTIAGEPNSGATAGVYVPGGLLSRAGVPDQFSEPGNGRPADAGIAAVVALDDDRDGDHDADKRDQPAGQEYVNGHPEVPIVLLPQRDPGASGISAIPASVATPAAQEQDWSDEEWPADSMPAQTSPVPTDTSGFFAARPQAGFEQPEQLEQPESATAEAQPSRHAVLDTSATDGADDADDADDEDDPIYRTMLSEWLVDPTEIANSEDLDWESVWDHGWSAAAAAEDGPVLRRTEDGLPLREPGARLVPGGMDSVDSQRSAVGEQQQNGGAHRSTEGDDEVASAAEFGSGGQERWGNLPAEGQGDDRGMYTGGAHPLRDPDAVRASIGSHFGGVHAGRAQARETEGTDNQ